MSIIKKLKDARPEYKWKVQSANEYSCSLVAYIDARQVMEILDDAVGPENWQDHYREVAGNVYCDLSIRVKLDTGYEWITKSDCGSESTFEKEKGQASDAFKRAAVKWGVGRFLYGLDIIKTKSVQAGKKYFPAYENGKRIWDVTQYCRKLTAQGVSTVAEEAVVEMPVVKAEKKKPASTLQEFLATGTQAEKKKAGDQDLTSKIEAIGVARGLASKYCLVKSKKEKLERIEACKALFDSLFGYNRLPETLKELLKVEDDKLNLAVDSLNAFLEG